jgi:UDPglucose 6-dehydrogenase
MKPVHETASNPTSEPNPSGTSAPVSETSANGQLLPGVKVAVIGAGFVGLVSAAGFAEFGHSVVCIEKDEERLKLLRDGKIPFYEPELAELIERNVKSKKLSFSNNLSEAVVGQKVIFVAVGTPASESGRTDLGALHEVAESLSSILTGEQILVLKSTVPLGSAQKIRQIFQSYMDKSGSNGSRPPAIISNPEFLREGSAVYDFFNPERVVIGGDDTQAIETVIHVHKLGMLHPAPFVVTNNETAEMIKYASNAYLATKIGFANELAGLCDSVEVNVMEVVRGMGMDSRIGADFLNPGPGWGGSCLPKDIKEYIGMAKASQQEMLIADAVLQANHRHQQLIVEKTEKLLGGLKDKVVGVLGLAFKAGTSDMRSSPTIPIINGLLQRGASVRAFDPIVKEKGEFLPAELEMLSSSAEVLTGADCLLLLTEWQEFQLLDWESLGSLMKTKKILDARNLLPPELLRRHGYEYSGMGQI